MTAYLLLLVLLVLVVAVGVGLQGERKPRRLQATGDTKNVPRSYPSIQAAINASRDGDVVVVHPGIYTEDITLGGTGITIRSRDPHDPEVVAATVIRGTGRGSVVTFLDGETHDLTLEGVTITGGAGRPPSGGAVDRPRAGGGIFVPRSSSPTLRHLVIRGNSAGSGGGIYVEIGSGAVLGDNVIEDNEAHVGGGICIGEEIEGRAVADGPSEQGAFGQRRTADLKLEIMDNRVAGNQAAFGAGLALSGRGQVLVRNNDIQGNTADPDGGGICIWDGSGYVVDGNRILRNAAGGDFGYGGGISVVRSSDVAVRGNTIEANRALGRLGSGGGGISVHKSQVVLVGNRVAGNEAAAGGGICIWGHSQATIDGNSIRGNRASVGRAAAVSASSSLGGRDVRRLSIAGGTSDLPGGTAPDV